MRNKLRNLLLVTLISVTAAPGVVTAQSQTVLCSPGGITVGFFNGVWNTRSQAQSAREALAQLYGDTYAPTGEPISYDNFFNTTGSEHGATGAEDLIETFKQRAAEQDAVLQNRFELFWEAISSDTQQNSFTRVLSTVGAFAGVLGGIYDDIRAKTVAALTSWASTPPTLTNYLEHQARVDGHLAAHKKVVLVAHSQGNLFMNAAYRYATSKAGAAAVKAVHIAPASPTLNGEYTLADLDLVINGLRLIGTVPANNVKISATGREDVSGHELVRTYLNEVLPPIGPLNPRGMVKQHLGNALSTVQAPQSTGSDGFFTVTLTWDGAGDVDLHSIEPTGRHVFYAAKKGLSGELDVDNIVGFGPEHYTATCDATKLALGTYAIGVNNFSGATGRTATVQIASYDEGVLLTRSVGVGMARGTSGDNSPIPVATVQVRQEGTGRLRVTAQ
ncbi:MULTISPECIES: YfaP family protein [Cupriavidus]|uniref:YfaP family protein n=1 Tax=Cupriavidus TaxID=106589 RepID=UPI001F2B0E87|nr:MULTISPECIES: hypothetical protein [Cupriavidus]